MGTFDSNVFKGYDLFTVIPDCPFMDTAVCLTSRREVLFHGSDVPGQLHYIGIIFVQYCNIGFRVKIEYPFLHGNISFIGTMEIYMCLKEVCKHGNISLEFTHIAKLMV